MTNRVTHAADEPGSPRTSSSAIERNRVRPKYYVETGRVRLVISAQNATEAAVKAFPCTCDRQSEIYADSLLDHCRRAGEAGCRVAAFELLVRDRNVLV